MNSFNTDCYDGKFKIENNAEKKWMKMSLMDKESVPLVVKIKFFGLEATEEDEEKKRLRIRFTKKRGDLVQWYGIFKEM